VTLAERIRTLASDRGRVLVGIAGPPGAGKSTLSATLSDDLQAPVVEMDGFHLDNAILDERDLRARKGAPETFDAAGFAALLARIRGGETVLAPVFDRTRDLARSCAREVSGAAPVVLVEGNYLLLDEPAWRPVAGMLDLSVLLTVPVTELERRLIDRWLGFGLDRESAAKRARENDLANARLVMAQSSAADLVLDIR